MTIKAVFSKYLNIADLESSFYERAVIVNPDPRRCLKSFPWHKFRYVHRIMQGLNSNLSGSNLK